MTVAPRTAPEFVEWLVGRHPPLAAILDEHLSDYGGEMLSHVLFGEVTRYAADLAHRATLDPRADEALQGLLNDLDEAMLPEEDDDDPVNNLIWVSFVENAQGVTGDPETSLRDRLRSYPSLGRALSHYE
jgi:hypothetical protein